jgi:uncharacterized membrane protein
MPWPCAGEPVVTWTDFGAGFVSAYCDACHAPDTPDRHGAPPDAVFDTFPTFRADADRVRARVLEAGDMPPGGGVTDQDRAHLEILLRCGL